MSETIEVDEAQADLDTDSSVSPSSEKPESPGVHGDNVNFTHSTGRVIAGLFALASFGVAMISGLASDNPASSVLARSLMVMFVSYPVGWIVGLICQHVIDDHLTIHQQANPALDSTLEFPASLQPPKEAEKDEEILTV